MQTTAQPDLGEALSLHAAASTAFAKLERVLAAVRNPQDHSSEFARALAALGALSSKEGIPIAIIGGLAAIKYGYQRLTHDIDVVVAEKHLYSFIQVAPSHGIKVIWHDPHGWHKLQCEGVKIEIIPEGGKPRKDAPTTVPSPKVLGVSAGLEYASLAGWIETKIASARQQDKADVVQVLKKSGADDVARVRLHLQGVNSGYLRQFDELFTAAAEEIEQEETRGGRR